jgi:hypothetical protein
VTQVYIIEASILVAMYRVREKEINNTHTHTQKLLEVKLIHKEPGYKNQHKISISFHNPNNYLRKKYKMSM